MDYCQLLSCESDKSSLHCDSALALVIVTIKDTVTTQAKYVLLSHSRSYNNPFVPAVIRGDFLQYSTSPGAGAFLTTCADPRAVG